MDTYSIKPKSNNMVNSGLLASQNDIMSDNGMSKESHKNFRVSSKKVTIKNPNTREIACQTTDDLLFDLFNQFIQKQL